MNTLVTASNDFACGKVNNVESNLPHAYMKVLFLRNTLAETCSQAVKKITWQIFDCIGIRRSYWPSELLSLYLKAKRIRIRIKKILILQLLVSIVG